MDDIATLKERAEDDNDEDRFIVRNDLGYRYTNGVKGCEVDIEQALKYFTPVTQATDKVAASYSRYMIGTIILRGLHPTHNAKDAVGWLKTAAGGRCTGAMTTLGQLNERGIHMQTNHAEAASLFLKVFLLGDMMGAVHLGFMHVKGHYFKQSDKMGVQYFKHAGITPESTIKSIQNNLDMDIEPNGLERQREKDLYKLAIMLVKSHSVYSTDEQSYARKEVERLNEKSYKMQAESQAK